MRGETAAGTARRSALNSLTMGLIVVDLAGMITLLTHEVERLAKLNATAMQGIAIDQSLAILGRQPPCCEWPVDRPQTYAPVMTCDQSARHLSFTLSPLQSGTAERLGTVIIVIDDLTQQRYQAGQTQRAVWMSAMGERAAGIAQEVSNALGSMELSASLLKHELAGDAERSIMAEHILSGVKSLNQSISNMLLFTKCPIPRFAAVDLHQLLEDPLVFPNHPVRHHHLRWHKRFEVKRVTIHADAALLKQVFPNLILDALQAMPEGGDLTLATRAHSNACKGRIGETGAGMPPHVIENIFNPFAMTKERGTRLGLTIIHSIVEAPQGTIHVVSTEGGLALHPHSPCRVDVVEMPGSRDMGIDPW